MGKVIQLGAYRIRRQEEESWLQYLEHIREHPDTTVLHPDLSDLDPDPIEPVDLNRVLALVQ